MLLNYIYMLLYDIYITIFKSYSVFFIKEVNRITDRFTIFKNKCSVELNV